MRSEELEYRFESRTCKVEHPCPSRPHPPLSRSPFSYKEKALTPLRVGIGCFQHAASGALPRSGRGEAQRRCVGWVGGVYPSAPITARTAAFDGHMASTRAACKR